jgi:hypothetical protein
VYLVEKLDKIHLKKLIKSFEKIKIKHAHINKSEVKKKKKKKKKESTKCEADVAVN